MAKTTQRCAICMEEFDDYQAAKEHVDGSHDRDDLIREAIDTRREAE